MSFSRLCKGCLLALFVIGFQLPTLGQSKAQITVLYDAFGKKSTMPKEIGATQRSLSTAANAFSSTPATTQPSLLEMQKPKELI